LKRRRHLAQLRGSTRRFYSRTGRGSRISVDTQRTGGRQFAHSLMKTLKAFVPCALAAALLCGCAWTPQSATLKPDPNITPSTIGHGVTVAVRVIDKRESDIIGHRGVDSKNAAITTTQNVPALFQEKIIEGLVRKGFSASPFEGQPGRLLIVEIRQIAYTTDMEFWKGIVRTEVVLGASMIKDGAKFEQFYTGKRTENTVEAPGAKTNERLINGAISEALRRMFEDEHLIRYLAE
jgi:uncharacterized lipoprotein YajG